MDHQPFENWLLENKGLTGSEKHLLTAHLQSCPSCRALAEVDLALKSTRMAAPAEGFTIRFQERLAARKLALRRRNFWGFLILSACALGLFAWLTVPLLADLVQSPAALLASWLTTAVSIWAGFQALYQGVLVLFKVIPAFVPGYIWAIFFLIAAGIGFLWVFSLRKFFKFPQGA